MSLGRAMALATERVAAPVEGMHRHIAGRWFAALGAAARPVQAAHDAAAAAIYGSIRLGATAFGASIEALGRLDARKVDAFGAFVDGVWGDAVEKGSGRSPAVMSLRDRHGNSVAMDDPLSEAFAAATGRIVVLVHGLIKTERCWHDTDTERGLLGRLEAEPDLTPVTIRYNTGLAVAVNGAHLATLLEQLHTRWPVPVSSITIIGHSMGGLVARSACVAGNRSGHRWVDEVDDIVAIGTPHRGAPLEKFAHAAAQGLSVAPVTRPLADFVKGRSQGIKDLRFGVVDGEFEYPDAGAAPRHHFVAGVVTADSTHPLGALIGDLMVRPASSTSAPRLEPTNVAVLGGVNHFDLLHDPDVIDAVLGWLKDTTNTSRRGSHRPVRPKVDGRTPTP